jgi:hypothetical protein
MYPPVFATVSADAGVQAALGTNPVRVFPFGQAPDEVTMPYAVWQTVSGAPENYLAETPDVDTWLVQMDVYAATGGAARTAAEALRDAIEPVAHIVAWRGERKEDDGIFRYSFDINFITER